MNKNEKYEYVYEGPIYLFDKSVMDVWSGRTFAKSEKKALANLTYQFKSKFGYSAKSKYRLDPKCLYQIADEVSLVDEVILKEEVSDGRSKNE